MSFHSMLCGIHVLFVYAMWIWARRERGTHCICDIFIPRSYILLKKHIRENIFSFVRLALSFHIDDFIQRHKICNIISSYIPDNKNVKTKPEIRLKHFPYKINNSILFVLLTTEERKKTFRMYGDEEKQKPSFIYYFFLLLCI